MPLLEKLKEIVDGHVRKALVGGTLLGSEELWMHLYQVGAQV